MDGLYFVLPTLLAVFVSMLVVRAGAVAFVMTGMDMERAKFQALSAFSGTGFTTREAEQIVNHRTRRRIATWLMILGNAGVVTVIITATSSLVSSEGAGIPLNALLLGAGLFGVYVVGTRAGVLKSWEEYVQEKLGRSDVFEARPVEELLHVLQGHGVARVQVPEDSPLAGRTLAEGQLSQRGALVLGIERTDGFVATPTGCDRIEAGDRLIVYGNLGTLRTELGAELAPAT
ncbi:MAG TPA: TrkA C-terminal domain-containing protein [Polyangiaceae bacterium LLY-WYZ-15_(1-7)]|nr:hypothetical protein [Sandaracinus sp.]HJL01677.1 TrkA C-terminal domain-containing protein [Polyangiaceae bacterium LLY-WYZ-15_(1-7)]HJL08717.1 TrkA C-terminal domain-containing protein [Polyangiaceae bacterium LLY-WYZ-15_(1-7)]HJL30213.1 TrkA C-terminal domain-containing protein [Polyangiaceae bacterium LLY-WYZ-15_(1-7)]